MLTAVMKPNRTATPLRGSFFLPIAAGSLSQPISDALEGLVYLDDDQVSDIVCRKRNLNHHRRVENPSSGLADGFSQGNEFLHIVVEEAPDREVITCWKP